MFPMWTGNEFQAAGPATVNELSASRVLVRRTTKLPRVDDRRRWSLQRLHRSVRYSGAVPWKTWNIRTHNFLASALSSNRAMWPNRARRRAWIVDPNNPTTVNRSLQVGFCGQSRLSSRRYYPSNNQVLISLIGPGLCRTTFGQGQYHANLFKWGLFTSDLCKCGQPQTMTHTVQNPVWWWSPFCRWLCHHLAEFGGERSIREMQWNFNYITIIIHSWEQRTKLSTHKLDCILHVDNVQSFPHFVVATTTFWIEVVSAISNTKFDEGDRREL